MSELDRLLDGVDVEWKTMWEVTNWDKKFNAVENYKQPITVKYQHLLAKRIKELISETGNIKILTTNETNLWTTEELASSLISEGEIVAIPWGGNTVVQYYNGKFITGDNRIAISNNTEYLNTKYLYYFMLNNIQLLSSFYRGSGIKHPSMSRVLEMKIPIPALNIQKEIVRILDTFTELTRELTTELIARKKQYSYYREQLLRFRESEVEWKSLSEVAQIGTGSHNTQDAVENGSYTFYARGIKPLQLNSYDFDETAIITAGDGAGVGKVYHWVTGKYALHQRAYRIVPNEDVNGRYIYHYILAFFYLYIQKASVSSSVTSLRKPMFLKFKVPIPSLEEQERIVNILDKFDMLTTSISDGLPKEIELRNKQYEYYRSKLLDFSS